MGRIRKPLPITSVIAAGGALRTHVKWESPSETAPKERARLVKEQSQLLSKIAQHGQAAAPTPLRAQPRPRAPVQPAEIEIEVYLKRLNLGCDKTVGSDVGWTRYIVRCDCTTHHRQADRPMSRWIRVEPA